MNSDINLVSPKQDQSSIDKKRIKLLRITAIGFVGVIALFAIIIFIIQTTFSVEPVKKRQESALIGITSLKDKSGKLFVVNDRLLNISSLLKSRKNYSPIINKILSLVPDQAQAVSIQLDQEKVSLVIVSESLLPLNTFLNNITKLVINKQLIENLNIDSLAALEKSGKYSLSVSAQIL